MSQASQNDCDNATTRPLPLVLPMPRAFYRSATAPSPWVAVDPVFGAHCVSLYRSIRLTFLALIAFLSGPRTLRAEQTNAAQEIGTSATLTPHTAAVPLAAMQAVRQMRSGSFTRMRRTSLNLTSAGDSPRRDIPQVAIKRAHAPPALQRQGAFSFSRNNLPPPGTVGSAYLAIFSPSQDSLQFIIKRTHAPPAKIYPALRTAKRFHHPAYSLVVTTYASHRPSSGAILRNPSYPQFSSLTLTVSLGPGAFIPWVAGHFCDQSSTPHYQLSFAFLISGRPIPIQGDNDHVRF